MGKQQIQHTIQTSLTQKLLLASGGLAIIMAGVLGILGIYQVNSDLDLHEMPVCLECDSDYLLYELTWGVDADELDWEAGQLEQVYSNVDDSGTEFSITYSGATDLLGSIGGGNTPNVQTFFPSDESYALSNYVTSGFEENENIMITIDIHPAIPGHIAFDLYHINGSSFSGDKITMYVEAEEGGVKIYPEVVGNGSSSWEDQGSGVINATGSSTRNANAYVGVNFRSESLINKLVFVWGTCDICGGGQHGIGIGNIQFYNRGTLLPVSLHDVRATWDQESARIQWETSKEMNADHFEVERSEDRETFETLGEVSAVGNSDKANSYEYVDRQAFYQIQNALYYRLRQVDMNGAYVYSDVVELKPEEVTSLNIQVFPNPASEQVTIKIPQRTEAGAFLQVLSLNGKTVLEQPLGSEFEWRLSLADWPAGTYVVNLHVGGKQLSKPLHVVH